MTKSRTNNSNFITGCVIVLSLVSLIALGPYFNFQQIVLVALMPLLAILAFKNDVYTFTKGNKEILLFTIIVILSFVSTFLDINFNLFLPAIFGIIGALLGGYAAVGLNKTKSYEAYFHIGYIISVLCLILIEVGLGNFSLAGFASVKASRGRFFFNANYYSYITYFANFSLFFLHQKYKKLFFTLMLLFLPIVFVIVAFITQSRSGLFLIIAINFIYWFFIFKPTNKSRTVGLIKTIFTITAAIYLAFQFLAIYGNSQIKSRISTTKEDSREVLILDAIDVFTNNPLLGVGLGQFPRYSSLGQFSHNSYTEILAEQGIVGGILISLLFFSPIVKSYRLLKSDLKNPVYKLNLLFFLTFLFYNNAYVFYKVSFAMIYFFLIVTAQNKISPFKT